MKKESSFQSIVFAGGGSRCMWEAGFWVVAKPALNINPSQIACVSAGAAIACMVLVDRVDEGLSYFKKLTGANKRNVYLKNMFKKDPVFPHYGMYREVIMEIFGKDDLKKLKNGPQIRVLLARPPKLLGPRSATFTGMLTYTLEKKISSPVHPSYSAAIGFKPQVVVANDCESIEELADLIISSSCTPPFVPVMKWDNKISLDGGLLDNVPVSALDAGKLEGSTLVFLTRQYPLKKIPDIEGRLYIQPSEPISVSKWDYTDPDGLQAAFDLGRRDGEDFVKSYANR